MQAVLSILTLFAVLLYGVAPVLAFGAITACPQPLTAPVSVDERPACCANPDHRDSKPSEPAKDPCKDCRACFCCKVAPAHVNLIPPLSVVAVAEPMGVVLANDSMRYLSVQTIPDVPPPKA